MDRWPILAVVPAVVLSISLSAADADEGGLKPPTLRTVFGGTRMDGADAVHFWNGDVYRGEVLNETVGILTPYGQFSIPLRKCAAISFEGTPFNSETVVTVNFNRMTGLITDKAIRIKLAALGQESTIRKGRIRYILLRHSESETAFMKDRLRADLFVMANKDLLTGKATVPDVAIKTDVDEVAIPFADIEEVVMEGGRDVAFRVELRGGEKIKGKPVREDFSIDLDNGLRAERVHNDLFKRIYVDDGYWQATLDFGLTLPKLREMSLPMFANGGQEYLMNSLGMKFVLIPAGEFVMGSERGHSDERPPHRVTLSQAFHLGVHEVTQGQWNRVMTNNPSRVKGDDLPVYNLLWSEVEEFIAHLSEKEGIEYRLPTEAEWEYACRAGSTSEFYWGEDSENDYAWYTMNSGEKPHPVGLLKPNAWGLYDMSGNVYEWCQDFHANYATRDQTDPFQAFGTFRVYRGGAYNRRMQYCGSARRYSVIAYRDSVHGESHVRHRPLGLRLVRSGEEE